MISVPQISGLANVNTSIYEAMRKLAAAGVSMREFRALQTAVEALSTPAATVTPPTIVAWQTTGTVVSSMGNADILFDTNSSVEGEDTASDYPMHSTTTNTQRFYAPSAGLYFYRFGVVITGGTAGKEIRSYVLDKTLNVLGQSDAVFGSVGETIRAQVSGICCFAAGDWLKLVVDNLDSSEHTTVTGRGCTEGQLVKLW